MKIKRPKEGIAGWDLLNFLYLHQPARGVVSRSYSTSATSRGAEAEEGLSEEDTELGMPSEPTWSVYELLDRVKGGREVGKEELEKLHRLAALELPSDEEGLLRTKKELEAMIGLVDAVRSVDVEKKGHDVGIGRIWPEGRSQRLSEDTPSAASIEDAIATLDREKLLGLAKRTERGFYVVDRPGRGEPNE